jgi:hypothetical protein
VGSASGTVFASGFPADGAERRDSGVPFGGRRPPARNLAFDLYGNGVSLMTPQVEWGTLPGPGGQPPPGPLRWPRLLLRPPPTLTALWGRQDALATLTE